MADLKELMTRYVPATYIGQGLDSIATHEHVFEILLQQGKLPLNPWTEICIEFVLNKISLMDSNNFPANVGVGEREGRVFSPLVARRHYHLSHGIGRSGDIIEVQPKAAGSSLLYKLTNMMVKHALQIAGIKSEIDCIVFPLATGMTLAMSMMTLRSTAQACKRYVIWPRIDQKSCFKSILAAGLTPIVVENVCDAEGMKSNIEEIRGILAERSHEVLCVLSTTSCFAPRQPDLVDQIAKLCKEFNVGHIINNAYGLQCQYITKLITRATRVGRVDAIVQSTDKNFLVPVGGAIVASTDKEFLKSVSSNYPGRASSAPILDLFITLLSMGEKGYRDLLRTRNEVIIPAINNAMQFMTEKHSLPPISSPHNSISYAYSLNGLPCKEKGLTFLGSMLFQRNVSGCRIVLGSSSAVSKIAGYEFRSWGAHAVDYDHNYFTIACAIGMQLAEVELFLSRLDKTLSKYVKINTTALDNSGSVESDTQCKDVSLS